MTGTSRVSRWQSIVVAFSMVASLVVVLPGQPAPAQTAPLTVDTNDTSCSDVDPNPNWCTIGAAVGAAANGDTIQVAPGVYNETLSVTKTVHIVGTGTDASGVEINADGIVQFNGAVSVSGAIEPRLENLTVTGAFTENPNPSFASLGGGITVSSGALTLLNVRITGNRTVSNGGGVHARGASASVVILSSTIDNNIAGSNGAGLYITDGASADVINSTISGNTDGPEASSTGAVNIRSGSSLFMDHSTVVDNDVAGFNSGVAVDGGGAATVINSVLANNTGQDCSGGFTDSSGYNLVETLASGGCALLLGNTSIDGVDPQLGPLTDNGGPTPTHLPLDGSPLLDVAFGDSGGSCTEADDQRGTLRPQGFGCDIGSVELEVAASTFVQSLIDNADPFDVVVVPAGVYNESIVIGDDIALVGGGDTAADTVISAAGLNARTVTLSGNAGFQNLTITDGESDSQGGNILNDSASLTLTDVIISNGTGAAGGGVFSSGTLDIEGSTIVGNTAVTDGGGFGGGIGGLGTVNIVNSTIHDNRSEGDAGGLGMLDGIATLNNVTISSNSAAGQGGAFNGDVDADIRVSNTLSSGNTNGDGGPDCDAFTSLGNNVLEGNPSGCALLGTDILGSGPLGPLQFNEGPTPTRALGAGHPAIDAGAISVDYPAFDAGNLVDWQLNGFTDLDTGGTLLLAAGDDNVGSAFLIEPRPVDRSFGTQFQFQITADPDDADGITFTITDSPTTLGRAGGFLGISVLSGIDPVPTPVVNGVSVEFDTWPNGAFEGANDGTALDSSNHIGIDIDGDLSSVSLNPDPIASLSQGVWTAWVEYDASATTLDVWASNTGSRPSVPTVSTVVDITAVMGSSTGYFGFTGATGFSPTADITGAHRILNFAASTGVPCASVDQRDVTRPQGAGCDIGAFETVEGTMTVTDVTTDTTSVEAGYAVPLAAIPAERLLVGADSVAGAPLGAIGDLSSSPLGAIPLGAIPLGAIGGTSALGQTLLSEIPITGGWEPLLEGTDFAGRPLQTLTLDQVSAVLDPVELAALGLGDLRIGDSALADLSIAALTLGDVPLNQMGLPGTDSVLDIETGGGSIAAVPLGAIPLGAIPLGAIGSPSGAPLGAIPLGAIPLGAIPLGAIDSPAGTPLGAIGDLAAAPLGAIPLGAIPLGAIPLGAIPLGAIQLGAIPLGAIGTDCGALGCPTGITEESTVSQYLDATGSDLASSPLGAIPLGAIQLGAIQLGAIDVSTLPLGAIPLGAINTSTPLGAISLVDLPLGAIGTDIATVCAEVSGTCDGATLLADYASALPPADGDLSSTPLGAIQLGAIPLGAIEFSTTGLNGVPLGAISIAGVPLGAIELDSIDLVNSPLGAIPLGAISLPICGSSDSTLTLVEAAALGGCAGATLDDLGAALDGRELADVLDHLTFGFLGQIIEFDSLTYGEIVVSILLAIDFPWEDLPLDEIETRDVACGYDRTTNGCTVGDAGTRPDLVTVDVDVDVTGGNVDGPLVDVTIPDGWAVIPGSASVLAAGASIPEALNDPLVDDDMTTFSGSLSAGLSTISFAVAPDFEVGTGFTVSAATAGGSTPVTSGGISVTEGLEFGDIVAQAQQVAADTLYVGYIRRSGDQDWWNIPAPAPGFRVAVYLSNLAGDVDTFVYRPESAPLGVDTNSRSIPLGTVPISDDEFDFDGTDTQSPEVLGDSVVDEPSGQVLGDSSTNRGTEDEFSEFFSRDRDAGGDYTIQVAGFQGATSESPYVLRVKYKSEVPTPTCTARSLGPVGGSLPAIPADVDTIFLVNWDRMESLFGAGSLGSLPADLSAFAASTVGGVPVNGVVIPIGAIPGVSAGFSAWDANPCDPAAANVIVDNIVSYVQGVADAHPTLRHVTVVGSDEVVPFARLEDETIVANESTYTEGFADNALYGSQFTRHYLSDAPYGDLDPVAWLDRFAYLPDLGVGRLVETPTQIAAAISTFQANGGLLDPQTAATAGYDFLTDGAEQVKSALSGLTDLDPLGSLLTEDWTRQDLADTAFGASGGAAADLVSPNAHYDHYRALPAIGNMNQSEDDLFTIDDVTSLGNSDLVNRIIFTVGCHSALNVPNLASNEQPEDWAEVYGDQRAIYIGNTGYGYGDTATVALSEQVMANLAFNLGNGQTIGQNLSQAKQDQFGKAGLYGVYDLKAIEEATLYGLPFWRVDIAGASPIVSNGSDTEPVDTEPETGLLAAPFSASPEFASIPTADGTFYTADGGTQFLHWRPIQPKTEIDVTQDDLVATGVILTDLESEDIGLVDPVFGRPNTSDLSGREPEVEFVDSIFPTSFASIGTSDLLNPSRSGDPTSIQQRVNLLAGQYVGPLDTQRLFNQIDGQVYYAADATAVDWSPPVITRVDADVVGDQATFLVEGADPDSGVSRVVVLYRSSVAGDISGWTAIDLVPVGGDEWAGGGSFDASLVPPLDYIVQMVNGDGAVAVSTFKGEFHKADIVPTGGNEPPTVGAISGSTGPVEVGTTVTFAADVSDDGPAPLTATWDFGDGTTATSDVSGGSTTVDHVYTEPGVYRVQLVVVDGAGAVGLAAFEFVVVYDPDGGFVTGGGWIDSPQGAYTADPTLTGKANFGFVSKYKKGQSTPTGNTTFQFKAADFKFKSTSYDWMVIAGKKAQYKGSGTVNGSGDYGFMLTAIDAALTPSTDVDLFRIKIWDKSTDEVVYDNQIGASDGADPTTAIGGGSIVIHEPPRNGNR